MEVINFKLFVIFLLATTGLTLITNRSKLFQPVREWITKQYVGRENDRLMAQKKAYTVLFWWWLHEISTCYMCASIYTGSVMAVLSYLSLSLPWLTYVLFVFASVPVATLIIQHWVKTEKK